MVSNSFVAKHLTKSVFVRLAIALTFLVIVMWALTPASEQQASQVGNRPLLKVSTVSVAPGEYVPNISVVGVTQPRWPLALVSAVEGRVKATSGLFEPGEVVADNALLVEIEEAAYVADLAKAQASIRQAELEVARIQHEKTVAEQIARDTTLSEFGRFEPHLASARAALKAARQSWQQAKKRLEETRMMAPFKAIVLDKQVVPGQWVNAGDPLLTLAASDSLDVLSELSREQHRLLGEISAQTQVMVKEPDGRSWPAHLRFVAPAYSEQTRQKQIAFFVENPFAGPHRLSPNTTVTVSMKGQVVENVVVAPATTLTPDGQVWVVENNRLSKEAVHLVEEFDDRVYFQFVQTPTKARDIVRFPVSTLLVGQRVDPVATALDASFQLARGGQTP